MAVAHSGKKIISAAGVAEALGSGQVAGPVLVKALAANTGKIYIGNDGAGDVASTNGLELSAGDVVVFQFIAQLSAILVDCSVSGEGVTWIYLEI